MHDDPDFSNDLDALEVFVEEGLIDPEQPAYGVMKQVIHDGVESLSPKQRFVYERHLAPIFERKCAVCHANTMSDIAYMLENDSGVCSYHHHQLLKDD